MPFIGYPSAFLYPKPEQMRTSRAVEHYPWGYWIATTTEKRNGFIKVKHRWTDNRGDRQDFAWIREVDIQANRILEVNFVDIGQGDGVFVVFPDDKRMLIDAGQGDNMYRFLRWRFNRKQTLIHHTVVSHPDQDHYLGLRGLVNDPKFSFDEVYHNGIVERTGSNSLGPRTPGRGSVLTDVIETPVQLDRILGSPSQIEGKKYPTLLKDLHDLNPGSMISMINTETGFLPGFGPGQHAHNIVIEILGPSASRANPGSRLRLPWFGSVGETKNGHSVVLRLKFGNIRLLLGGDLNIKAERYLLEQHTRLDPRPATIEQREEFLNVARATFECDVMKACHHGSADVEDLFVESVNPLATVISSGDNEPHCHPRPDALGIYGKFARGHRPLIFSTELARSTKEYVSTPEHVEEEILRLVGEISLDTISTAETQRLTREIKALIRSRERSVAVYGMITVRTDGQKLAITQKLESKRSITGEKWDIQQFEPGADGRLRYLSKH